MFENLNTVVYERHTHMHVKIHRMGGFDAGMLLDDIVI